MPYINDGHGDTPMPGYIMAISPGTCADTEEEWQRMLELDKKDVAIPAEYMKTAVGIMRHGDDTVPDYMIWLQRGDFTNCPKVTRDDRRRGHVPLLSRFPHLQRGEGRLGHDDPPG